jgi:hypothetical protein
MSQGDLFSGTAAALVRSGVAAVTAMQYAISDLAAVAFSRGFYTALAHGRGVDEAVSAGRVGILGTSGRTLEWVTPVMYLRGSDARLFTVPPADSSERVSQGAGEASDDAARMEARKPGEPPVIAHASGSSEAEIKRPTKRTHSARAADAAGR